MTFDNKRETELTIAYLRDLADMLEGGNYHLSDILIESRSICWNIEEEEFNVKFVRSVNNG